MSGTLLSNLLPSSDDEYAWERLYHALGAVRARVNELEALAEHDELVCSAAAALLEAQANQLASLVRTYERARTNKRFKQDGTQITA